MDTTSITSELRLARFSVAMASLLHAAVFATLDTPHSSYQGGLAPWQRRLGFALGGMAVGLLIGTRLTGRMERRGRTAVALRVVMPPQALALIGPAFAWDLFSLTAAPRGVVFRAWWELARLVLRLAVGRADRHVPLVHHVVRLGEADVVNVAARHDFPSVTAIS
jgi:hypothetical protein